MSKEHDEAQREEIDRVGLVLVPQSARRYMVIRLGNVTPIRPIGHLTGEIMGKGLNRDQAIELIGQLTQQAREEQAESEGR